MDLKRIQTFIYSSLQRGDRLIRAAIYSFLFSGGWQFRPERSRAICWAGPRTFEQMGLVRQKVISLYCPPSWQVHDRHFIRRTERQYLTKIKEITGLNCIKASKKIRSVDGWLSGNWGPKSRDKRDIVWLYKTISNSITSRLGEILYWTEMLSLGTGWAQNWWSCRTKSVAIVQANKLQFCQKINRWLYICSNYSIEDVLLVG